MDDSTLVDESIPRGGVPDIQMEERPLDPLTKDAYDTLEIADMHDSVAPAADSQHDMAEDVTSFLRSAGVEVAEGHHEGDVEIAMRDGLVLHMDDHVEHHPHDAMMEEMMHLDAHGLHADDLQQTGEEHHDPATFDLNQIHQELHDAPTLTHHRRESMSAIAQNDVEHEPSFPEGFSAESHSSLTKTLFDTNMAPSPDDRGMHLEVHVQEEPIPTGVQIVNEEVVVNDIGLSPMGEGLPSTQVMESMHEGARLLAQQVCIDIHRKQTPLTIARYYG